MIELSTEEDTPLIARQTLVSPSVYLDHWAVRKLSEDIELCSRFVNAIKNRNGTLALSWLNLVEFSRVFDTSHANAAGKMVQDLYPNLFLIQIDPFIVIEQEDILVNQTGIDPPHADNNLLKGVLLLKPEKLGLFDAIQLFQAGQESDLSRSYDSLVETTLRKTKELNERISDERDPEVNLHKTKTSKAYSVGTRFILREIMRQLFLDRRTSLNENDAIDLVHTVVPTSYCDFILLDGRWRNLVERTRESFGKDNVGFTIAKPYSEKNNGLGKFINDLQDEYEPRHSA